MRKFITAAAMAMIGVLGFSSFAGATGGHRHSYTKCAWNGTTWARTHGTSDNSNDGEIVFHDDADTFQCPGATGPQGPQGPAGTDGEDGPNGVDGKDGTNGVDGEDGTNGVDGPNGVDGKDGTNGVDGENGKDGKNGRNGKTPVAVCTGSPGGVYFIFEHHRLSKGIELPEGHFLVSLENPCYSANGVNGKDGVDGKNGKDGVGIKGDAGFNGASGDRGLQGPAGESIVGPQGLVGPAGADGSSTVVSKPADEVPSVIGQVNGGETALAYTGASSRTVWLLSIAGILVLAGAGLFFFRKFIAS